MLWITGYAGCGKTTIASYIVQCLMENASPRMILCTFFFDGKIDQQRDPATLLRCLIYQMVYRRRKLLRLVRKSSDIQGMQLFNRFEALWELFVELVRHETGLLINIIMDGIDECQDQNQTMIINRITRLLESDASTQLKFLVTSRPNVPAIFASQENRIDMTWLQLEANRKEISEDIETVIHKRLDLLVRRGTCSPHEQSRLERLLGSKADNTFLWISLVLPLLEQRRFLTMSDVALTAQDLPSNLVDLYTQFLNAIPTGDRRLAGDVLRIVLISTRPLSMDELQIVLSMKNELGTSIPLLSLNSVQTLLGPLVKVLDGKVHLVHESFREYLLGLSTTKDRQLDPTFCVDPQRESLVMAEICMCYLDLESVGTLASASDTPGSHSLTSVIPSNTGDDQDHNENEPYNFGDMDLLLFKDDSEMEIERYATHVELHKFFDYAALNWAKHFAQADAFASAVYHSAAAELCSSRSTHHNTWFRYYLLKSRPQESRLEADHPVTVLAFLGLKHTLAREIDTTQLDANVVGKALYWAAREGHHACLEHLLDNLNFSQESEACYVGRQSPLSVAAEFGHARCMQDLIKSGYFDVNERARYGRTPLSLASGNGNADIVTSLLSNENTDPNLPDNDGSTPIMWAAVANSIDTLSRLLKHSRVEVDAVDYTGRNALSWAAAEGYVTVVDILLGDRRVSVANKDRQGWTPLIYATQHGHREVVGRLLSGSRSDPASRDINRRNAISWVAESQCYEILHSLLRHDPDGADLPDKDGWPPLAWALRPPGYPNNVSMLVQSGLVDINRRDNDGRTALSFAAGYGYPTLVQLMVRIPGVDVNSKDDSGRTPLSYAAGSGNADVVEFLLRQESVRPDSEDDVGRTPLSWAASAGHSEIVRILAQTPVVNP